MAIFTDVEIPVEDVIKNRAILLGLLCFAYPLSGQTEIYKCTSDGRVSYRDSPCQAGQSAIALVGTPLRVSHPRSAGPPVFEHEAEARSLFQRTGLAMGMTDTEVLNLRGWGRPVKIMRRRTDRTWHEEWTYFSAADGQRLLQFVNGELTAIDTDPAALPAPRPIAQTGPQ